MSEQRQPVIADRAKIRRRARGIVLAVIGAIIASLVGTALSLQFNAKSRVDRERLAVHERIDALRSERVLRPLFFEPEESGNGWDLLVPALGAIGALSEPETKAFASFRSDETEKLDSDKASAVLEKIGPQIADLKRMLRRREVEPDYPYEQHFHMKLPLLSKALTAGRILADAAKLRHDTGRTGDTVDLLKIAWGLADRIEVKGMIVNLLVGDDSRRRAADCLREILGSYKFSASELKRLQEATDTVATSKGRLMESCRQQDLMMRAAFVDFVDHGPGVMWTKELKPNYRDLFSDQVMAARALSVQDRYMAALGRAEKLSFRDQLEAIRKAEVQISNSKSILHRFLKVDAYRGFHGEGQVAVGLSLARLSLAIARHREERGAFPARLSDLAPDFLPAIPADAYSGHAFRYIVKDGAATVYSIGGDGDDDGGRPGAGEDAGLAQSADGDIVWTVKRAK
jgi:hypothetical protein